MAKGKASALSVVKPFCKFLPEIETPLRAVGLRDKVIWTAIGLLVYLICC